MSKISDKTKREKPHNVYNAVGCMGFMTTKEIYTLYLYKPAPCLYRFREYIPSILWLYGIIHDFPEVVVDDFEQDRLLDIIRIERVLEDYKR